MFKTGHVYTNENMLDVCMLVVGVCQDRLAYTLRVRWFKRNGLDLNAVDMYLPQRWPEVERMLEKLKAYAEGAKTAIIYVITPIILLVLYISHILNSRNELREELKAKDGNDKLKELQNEQNKVDSVASDAVSAFEKFRRSGGGSSNVQDAGGAGDPSSKSSD